MKTLRSSIFLHLTENLSPTVMLNLQGLILKRPVSSFVMCTVYQFFVLELNSLMWFVMKSFWIERCSGSGSLEKRLE